MTDPLWGGRFEKPPDPSARALSQSLSVDARLVAQDVEVSVAHVRGLADAGLLGSDDAAALEKALRHVGEEIAAGRFAFHPADEDVHSALERGVTERLGDLGARLHAGRSRNDLVVTDLRLWMLDAGGRLEAGVTGLVEVLAQRAGEHTETLMPGTTHGRLAQPITLGHHLLAHAFAFLRDLDRLDDWEARASVSSLGAGALATSTLPLDPAAAAARLGFERAFDNSLDAVSDRDFALEFLATLSILGVHLSRLAADLIRWSDESVGFARLDDAYVTGSSMMPQKRNPDIAELVRGKAARGAARFAQLTTVLAGLPLGYHRDLQEDKEPIFDAADTLELSIPALTGCLRTATFDPDTMRRALEPDGLYATDVAEALVAAGVPFREAHRRVGELLARLEAERRGLRELSEAEWAAFGLPGGASLLDPEHAVQARAIPGGPAPRATKAQLETVESALRSRSGGQGRG